jgi:transcription termination factor Rho
MSLYDINLDELESISLDDLKKAKPAELIKFAEEVGIENASTMRKQDIFVEVLKDLAEDDIEINGSGVVEVLQDGFAFLRAPEANYLPGPDDIYVSPSQIKKFALRTGDTVSGQIRAPRDRTL